MITLFEGERNPVGRTLPDPSADELVELLGRMGDDEQLALAEFHGGHRSKANFLSACGVAIDADAPGDKGVLRQMYPHRFRRERSSTVSAAAAVGASVVHETPNGVRGLVLFTHPVTSAEHLKAIAIELNRAMGELVPYGWKADGTNAAASQVWRGPRGGRVWRIQGAEPMDPDAVEVATPKPRRTEVDGAIVTDAYGLRAAERLVAEMRSAVNGSRAVTANRSAFRLGKIAHLLDAPHAWKTQLIDAAVATGLSRQEARQHVGRGFDAGQRDPLARKRDER